MHKGLIHLVSRILKGVILMGLSASLIAQDDAPPVPDARQLAAALSEPSSRIDTLLTMLAVSRLLQAEPVISDEQLPALEASFRDDRAWLGRLAARYARLPLRSTLFDPAAWFAQQEMGQHAIQPSLLVSPLGPGIDLLLSETFNRSDDRLAAAFLPEALFVMEFNAITVWQRLLEEAGTNGTMLKLVQNLYADWFDPWMAAEPPAMANAKAGVETLEQSMQSLQVQMASIGLAEPPDALRIKRLRFSLLTSLPQLDPGQARTARYVLTLSSAIDGLYDFHYLKFIQSLLWVVTDLLEFYIQDSDAWSPMPAVLVNFLPVLSAAMARNFSEVDSRFNTNLAATFDVVQELNDGELTGIKLEGLRQELADTVTQLVLLVPEMAFYFDQPVRRRISEEIDICISVAAVLDENGQSQMSRQQFDGCIQSMVQMADTLVRRAELAGDSDGPFGPDQLMRELEMTPWQRINYAIGYLHDRTPNLCPSPAQPLPNPLEWSSLATLLTWFSSRVPVYFQTPENEALIIKMRQQGLDLLLTMSQQVDCISGSGGSFNDLISVSLQQYRAAMAELVGGIREAELAFREANLRPGADVVLGGNTSQSTAYRKSGLMIGPCSSDRVCQMSGQLEATRALVGLFPDEYLLADQTGLGNVEICYDNMQWINQRSERVRKDDPNVANYFGHLSFDLVGRYHEGLEVREIFGSNFVSPDEYHYLIAAALEEVLEDGCPTEWVGTRVVTERTSDEGIQLVPNRLTYLAAARSRPSEIIAANWARGAEWRDWFVTGIGVQELLFDPDPAIRERLARHLRSLYTAEQRAIYSNLLRPQVRDPTLSNVPLYELMNLVTMYKGLLRNQLNLFYPEFMLDSDEIRAALEGQSGLLDEWVLRRFQENRVSIAEIHQLGLARLEQFQTAWKRQPENVIRTGSVAASVAHAVARLDSLYRQYFVTPSTVPMPEPLQSQAPVSPGGE